MTGNRVVNSNSETFPLGGERVELRPLEPSDIEAMAPFFGDVEEIYYYLPDTLLPRNLTQLHTMMDEWNDGKTNFVFACRHRDETIGLVTLSDLDPVAGNAEVGIMIAGRAYRGHGLASDAMKLVLDYAFGELRLHRICACVAPANFSSISLFKRLGFVEEGRMREVMRRGQGFVDLLLFGLLEDEYRKR